MRTSLDDVLRPNKYLLNIIGVWPMPQNAGIALKLFTFVRVVLSLSFLVALILPLLGHVRCHWKNVNILAESGGIVLALILLVYKLVYVVANQQSFCALHHQIQEFWDISNDDMERKSYEDFGLMAKLITLVACVSGAADFVTYQIAALVPLVLDRYGYNQTARHRGLPIDIEYVFDTQNTPNFEIAYIFQTISCAYCVIVACGNDCTMLTIVLHVSGQFRFISTRLRAIGQKIIESSYSNDETSKLENKREILRCLAHHQLVINVAENVSDLLSPMVFGQMLTSGLEICLSGYAVTDGGSTGFELGKVWAFFISMMVQLSMWCWPGEVLIQESTAVADAIFHGMPWFLLPASQQRDLSFVVLRSRKECHIATAFQIMSIEKLTEVLKAAGSYVALLQSIRDK